MIRNDDLRTLSWHELYFKVVQLRDAVDRVENANANQCREIQSILGELKAAQDKLTAIERPPTWTPPKSLRSGTYFFNEHGWRGYHPHETLERILTDYTRPANGRWRVENGAATWLGED